MSVDELIEKGADRLEDISGRLESENGLKSRVADELADDARFLRKLKPSAIAARAHGEVPDEDRRSAPQGPQLHARLAPPRRRAGGPSPVVVIAAALAVGYLLAKVVDWRSHAHPRL